MWLMLHFYWVATALETLVLGILVGYGEGILIVQTNRKEQELEQFPLEESMGLTRYNLPLTHQRERNQEGRKQLDTTSLD